MSLGCNGLQDQTLKHRKWLGRLVTVRRSRFLGVGLGKAAQLSEVSIREHVQGLGISLVRYTHKLQLLSLLQLRKQV